MAKQKMVDGCEKYTINEAHYPYSLPGRAPVSEVPEGWTWDRDDDDDHLENPYTERLKGVSTQNRIRIFFHHTHTRKCVSSKALNESCTLEQKNGTVQDVILSTCRKERRETILYFVY